MQRLIAILLVILMLTMILSACTSEPPLPADTSASTPTAETEKTASSTPASEETTASTSEPTETTPPPSFDERGYLSIKPFVDSRSEYIYIKIRKEPLKVLRLSVPKAWSFEGENGKYQITKEGAPIGELVLFDKDAPVGTKVQESEESAHGGLTIRSEIFSDAATRSFGRRLRFFLDGEEDESICTLITDYGETDKAKLVSKAYIELVSYNDPSFGVLDLSSVPLSKPILILGNSFVGTSEVGSSLTSMIQTSNVEKRPVTAVSVGYASVSKSWSEYEGKMKKGDYAAVFMCGFYSSSDVTALQKFADLCESSNTPLVIFPAHNESYEDSAHTKYPNLLFLDWKCEVDDFLSEGVEWSDLCINDSHNHSTPLAGYIGAHIIFRAVFGKVPSEKTFNDRFSYMRSPVFDYYNKNGYLRYLDDADILK